MKTQVSLTPILAALLATVLAVTLIACDEKSSVTTENEASSSQVDDETSHVHLHGSYGAELMADFPSSYPVTEEQARETAGKHGVEQSRVTYVDLVPYDEDKDGNFDLVWGVVEAFPHDQLKVTYLDPFTGELVAQEAPHEGLAYHLKEINADHPDQKGNRFLGTTPGTYENFPWGWNLPFCGSMSVSCGYGCGAHTGTIRWSTDWNLAGSADCGNTVAAPASGWVMDTNWNGNYGYQLVVKCKSAGNGRHYIWRVAHLKQRAHVTPGWWVWQGRDVADIGTTGKSTGCHIHFEVWRGTVSGQRISGETLPISNWPSQGDSVDGYDGSIGKSFTSGNNCSP